MNENNEIEERKVYKGIIYCYTNTVNGKKYVGQTINEKRKKEIIQETIERRESKEPSKKPHSNSKKAVGPDGTVYSTLTEAAKANEVSICSISNWIKNKPEKGWKYL